MAREAGAVSGPAHHSPSPAPFSLRLAKQDFAFAAAHFTLFPDGEAERLHGHNYRVRALLSGPALDEAGMLIAVAPVKTAIRALCAALDERVLIAEKSRQLELRREGETLCVRLGTREYRFPNDEVALLPLANITIEALARHLWQGLAPSLAGTPVSWLRIEVEETPGQCARYESAL
jgi:6-pyruvoyltetrahydropterin/6-carboxytetrahydropterin synthase